MSDWLYTRRLREEGQATVGLGGTHSRITGRARNTLPTLSCSVPNATQRQAAGLLAAMHRWAPYPRAKPAKPHFVQTLLPTRKEVHKLNSSPEALQHNSSAPTVCRDRLQRCWQRGPAHVNPPFRVQP